MVKDISIAKSNIIKS